MTKNQGVYVQCIYDCLQKIKRYTQGGKADFLNDEKTQDAVIRNLEVIGQAVKDIGNNALSAADQSIPWKQIAGTRNILAHQYLGVDILLIWEIIERDLPKLEQAITQLARRAGISL